MSGRGGQPDIQLLFLIARHGVPELLRVMAGLMETRGDIVSGLIREAAAIQSVDRRPAAAATGGRMTEPHAAVRATSRAAARSLTDSALSHMRLRVYGFVRDRAQGATCDETEAALGLRHQTASAQRANLSRFSNVLQRCRLVPYCNKQLDIMLCRPGLRELFLAGWLFTTGRNPPDP